MTDCADPLPADCLHLFRKHFRYMLHQDVCQIKDCLDPSNAGLHLQSALQPSQGMKMFLHCRQTTCSVEVGSRRRSSLVLKQLLTEGLDLYQQVQAQQGQQQLAPLAGTGTAVSPSRCAVPTGCEDCQLLMTC